VQVAEVEEPEPVKVAETAKVAAKVVASSSISKYITTIQDFLKKLQTQIMDIIFKLIAKVQGK
jgi:hypothetical protein